MRRSAVQLGLFSPFFLRRENTHGNLNQAPVFAISAPTWRKMPPYGRGSPSENGSQERAGRLLLFTGLDLTRDSINRYMTEHE